MMESTTNSEPQDVEAPIVGGIVLGVDTNQEEQREMKADGESPPPPRWPCHDD